MSDASLISVPSVFPQKSDSGLARLGHGLVDRSLATPATDWQLVDRSLATPATGWQSGYGLASSICGLNLS